MGWIWVRRHCMLHGTKARVRESLAPDLSAGARVFVIGRRAGRVITRWTATGTVTGQGGFLGVEPKDQKIEFDGIDIWSVWNGSGAGVLGLWVAKRWQNRQAIDLYCSATACKAVYAGSIPTPSWSRFVTREQPEAFSWRFFQPLTSPCAPRRSAPAEMCGRLGSQISWASQETFTKARHRQC